MAKKMTTGTSNNNVNDVEKVETASKESNSDLAAADQTSNSDESSTENIEHMEPPDGGAQAWLVMFSSFLCNGIIFGTINSYGVLFVYLKDRFKDNEDAATKASLVGSITVGATFLLSALAGILTDRFGIRKTAFFGGLLATLGMLLSSFFVDRIEVLCFTYGILFGSGSALAYAPSLVILGHYFKRHLGLVNGIVTAGSSIFTIAMPHILEGLLSSIGLENTLRTLAGMTSVLMLATLSFTPLHRTPAKSATAKTNICSQLINVDNWKNKKYVVWALAIPSALFGYFVPYVHIVQYVKDLLPEQNGGTLVTCIAITSGVGRIIFGKVADMPNVNGIVLQQISFISIGVCTMLLTAAPFFSGFVYESLIIFALIMGLFDGCFISLLGPIAYDIVGPAGASQAIGFLLSLCAIPLTVGPPIAGWMYDHLGNYNTAFIVAGIPPILGAVLMTLIYHVDGNATSNETAIQNDPELLPNQNVENGGISNGGMTESVTKTTFVTEDESFVEKESLLKV